MDPIITKLLDNPFSSFSVVVILVLCVLLGIFIKGKTFSIETLQLKDEDKEKRIANIEKYIEGHEKVSTLGLSNIKTIEQYITANEERVVEDRKKFGELRDMVMELRTLARQGQQQTHKE